MGRHIDQRIAIAGLFLTACGGILGWLLVDTWNRGVAEERMASLQQQVARISEIENQRQREKDRADRLDLEVASLRQRLDDTSKAHNAENARLQEALVSTQKELNAANLRLSAQQKCGYLDELTRTSKKRLDNLSSIVVASDRDAFAQQQKERRELLLDECEKNRTALLECLKN
ncbi:hypothetical protein [Bordetella sp. 2513F-2]